MAIRDFSGPEAGYRAAAAQPEPSRRRQSPSPKGAIPARFSTYLIRPFAALGPVLFTVAVLAALYYSWHMRSEGHLTPEEGAGYWFGIVGSSIMAFLLLYPLRKRVRAFRNVGRTSGWFQWHMVLGIIGPALIVVHSNWKLASMNATVATVVMLVVVASGIIGRYLYTRVHVGFYGRKAEVGQILADVSVLKEALGGDVPQAGQLLAELRAFEANMLAPHRGALSQMWAFATIGFRQAGIRGRMMRFVKTTIATEGKSRGWSWYTRRKRQKLARDHLRLYFAAVSKAARFAIYDKLFATWHVLHMPLFFLLVFAAIVHIVAVHLY